MAREDGYGGGEREEEAEAGTPDPPLVVLVHLVLRLLVRQQPPVVARRRRQRQLARVVPLHAARQTCAPGQGRASELGGTAGEPVEVRVELRRLAGVASRGIRGAGV